jgi:hypothetical protein
MNIAQQIKEKGKLEGIQQRDISIIQRMLKMGVSMSDISKYTGTSIDRIKNISDY